MKVFKGNFLVILVLVCFPQNSSLGSLLDFIKSRIPSFLQNIPLLNSKQINKVPPKNQEPLNIDKILGKLDSVTSASATLSELKAALNSSSFFATGNERATGSLNKRNRRASDNDNKQITFDDIEKWLDPVTSASLSKDDLRKILGTAFGARVNLPQERSIRNSIEKEAVAHNLMKILNRFAAPDSMEMRYSGYGVPPLSNQQLVFRPEQGYPGGLTYPPVTYPPVEQGGNPFLPLPYDNQMQNGPMSNIVFRTLKNVFDFFTKGLIKIFQTAIGTITRFIKRIIQIILYPLKVIGLIKSDDEYPSSPSTWPYYPNRIKRSNMSKIEKMLGTGFTQLLEKAREYPLNSSGENPFDQLPKIQFILDELNKAMDLKLKNGKS